MGNKQYNKKEEFDTKSEEEEDEFTDPTPPKNNQNGIKKKKKKIRKKQKKKKTESENFFLFSIPQPSSFFFSLKENKPPQLIRLRKNDDFLPDIKKYDNLAEFVSFANLEEIKDVLGNNEENQIYFSYFIIFNLFYFF